LADNLRDFRHRVAVLKRAGLITGKTRRGNTVDARSAYPTWTVNGKSLQSIVNKYDDVASGKATAVKVPRKQLSQFKKAGFETKSGKIIIPHSATEKVVREKGEVVIKSKSGLERVQIPVPFANLNQYLEDIRKDAKRINAMKRRNEYFGFKFFGNNSSALYSDIAHAIEDLQRYSAIAAANTRIKQQEIYRNLEIVRVNRAANWVFPSERRRIMSKAYNKKRMRAFRKNLKRKPAAVQDAYKEASRQRSKAYRARIKRKNNGQYKNYRTKAKVRSKKARTKAKRKRTSKRKK
jgi:hypothetical protein